MLKDPYLNFLKLNRHEVKSPKNPKKLTKLNHLSKIIEYKFRKIFYEIIILKLVLKS